MGFRGKLANRLEESGERERERTSEVLPNT